MPVALLIVARGQYEPKGQASVMRDKENELVATLN